MTETQSTKTVDIVELTKMLGLPDSDQSAVSSWTGEPYGTTWTQEEAAELVEIWKNYGAL